MAARVTISLVVKRPSGPVTYKKDFVLPAVPNIGFELDLEEGQGTPEAELGLLVVKSVRLYSATDEEPEGWAFVCIESIEASSSRDPVLGFLENPKNGWE